MGNGSVRKGSGGKVPFPRIVGRWNGSIPPVFGNESFEQLAHGLAVDFVPAQFVGVRYRERSPFAGCFYAGSKGVGRA